MRIVSGSALFSKNVSLQGQGEKFLLTAAKHEISSKAMDIFSAVSTFIVSTFPAGQCHHFPFFKFEVKNVTFQNRRGQIFQTPELDLANFSQQQGFFLVKS